MCAKISDEERAYFADVAAPQAAKIKPEKTSVSDEEKAYFQAPSDPNTWVKPPAPSVSEQLSISPELAAREGAAGLYSLPHTTSETYRFLAGKLQQYGEDLAAKEGRIITDEEKELTNKFVNYIPDLIQSANEKFPSVFPTYKQAKEKIGEKIEEHAGKELPEKARGAIERAAEGVGKHALNVAIPGTAAVKGAALGVGVAGEALDLSEKNKLLANLTVPAITSLIKAIITKRYVPSSAEAKRIIDAGERQGMTMKELAPILSTEGQVARHAKKAAGVDATRKAFEKTGGALGNAIENLQTRPEAAKSLSIPAENKLIDKITKIRDDITSRSHSLAPKEQELVTFLNTTLSDISSSGSTPKQLIGTWRSVNKMGAGKTELRRILEPLAEGIESVDKGLSKDLLDTNLMYSKFVKNLGEIKPGQYNAFMDAGELQSMLGSVFTGPPEAGPKALLRFITLNTLEKVSSKILTDPTAQSMVRNFGKAVRDGRKSSSRALGFQLKEYIKENLPEDYKSIKWEELGLENGD